MSADDGTADDEIDPDSFAAGRAQQQLLRSVHQHLREELQQIRDVVAQVVDGETDISAARHHINHLTMWQNYWTLGSFCASYCRVVAIHHTIEDQTMFPGLAAHEPRGLGRVQAWTEQLTTQLLEHLAYEEEQLLPAIGRLTTRII